MLIRCTALSYNYTNNKQPYVYICLIDLNQESCSEKQSMKFIHQTYIIVKY